MTSRTQTILLWLAGIGGAIVIAQTLMGLVAAVFGLHATGTLRTTVIALVVVAFLALLVLMRSRLHPETKP